MKVVPELVDVVKKQVEAGRTVRGQVGTIRVDLRHQEQKTFEAIYKTEDKEFHFLVDEPAIRGGLSRGPTPLGFFITGAGGWLIMQYTSLVLAQELPVDSLKMIVRGHYTRELPRAFTDVVFEVYLEGSISRGQLAPLAEEASRHCFVENTLAKAIPVTTEVYLNGDRALTLSRGPQGG